MISIPTSADRDAGGNGGGGAHRAQLADLTSICCRAPLSSSDPDDAEHHDIRRTICLFALVTPELTGMAPLPNGAGLWGKAGGFASRT